MAPNQGPEGPQEVSDRFRTGGPRGPCPARPPPRGDRAYLDQAEAERDAMSTFTPGPMVEESATFFR